MSEGENCEKEKVMDTSLADREKLDGPTRAAVSARPMPLDHRNSGPFATGQHRRSRMHEKRDFYRLVQLWGEVPTRVAGGSGWPPSCRPIRGGTCTISGGGLNSAGQPNMSLH
jgi:hypothetical protein